MHEGFQVIAVADLAGRKWQLQAPLPPSQPPPAPADPARANTKIHKMLRLGDTVEVFALPQTPGGTPPTEGLHETLLPPMVAIVIECALTTAWELALSTFGESPERINAVLDAHGREWTRGKAVPIDPTMTIERIEAQADRVECFARAAENTEWARNGVSFLFTLMPFTVQSVLAASPVQTWGEILRDREEEARLGDQEEPDAPDELEPEPEHMPAPSPLQGLLPSPAVLAPPANPNGQ
jgi:hypothetical protein